MLKSTKKRLMLQAATICGVLSEKVPSEQSAEFAKGFLPVILKVLLHGYFQGCGHSEAKANKLAIKMSEELLGA